MSTETSEDRRVRRTKLALWTALLGLINREDWDQINVRAICDAADVARSTFYLHFQNKQELLDYGFSIGRSEFAVRFDAVEADKVLNAILKWLVEHLAEGAGMQGGIQNPTNPEIFNRFKAAVGDVLSHQLARKYPRVAQTQILFVTGGVFEVIEAWLTNRCQIGQDDLIKLLEVEVGKILV